jgi:hypothetical protein
VNNNIPKQPTGIALHPVWMCCSLSQVHFIGGILLILVLFFAGGIKKNEASKLRVVNKT